jgi:hypothetical protein
LLLQRAKEEIFWGWWDFEEASFEKKIFEFRAGGLNVCK